MPMQTDLLSPEECELAVLVKGYPRLSETFIAQEIYGLQQRGLKQLIVALRRPHDPARHPVHQLITSPVLYLPEYVSDDRARVRRAQRWSRNQPGYKAAQALFLQDAQRLDGGRASTDRQRRWAQACVLAYELPESVRWIHCHYLHTPASVVRYGAALRGCGWSFSAHAKDIWISDVEDLAGKIENAAWGVTCTATNLAYLQHVACNAAARAKLQLLYHGLNFSLLEAPVREKRDQATTTFRIVSVGRLVAKKGYDVLLEALAQLPASLNWRFEHIGGGELQEELVARSAALGLCKRITWHGAQPRNEVMQLLTHADVFVLASRIAANGDRDGLPNVLMEAQAAGVCCVASHVSAIPELIRHGESGILVPPDDSGALSRALARLASAPDQRAALARAGRARVRNEFDAAKGLDWLAQRLRISGQAARGDQNHAPVAGSLREGLCGLP
ncbi:glycosyltransferase family 4 protein [Polycladidibacter hongkongensis]|uniref:glycosyltransferase family 4 protein n=1 Tax=Polycladidibacter hongkongensis TaxID=1647556 RepID=UPI000AA55F1E|nr:glycosyltransferase family 4 protein [Pseudovibrio hongkongensis]